MTSNNLEKINFEEATMFYKGQGSLVDYSMMADFSLIKSCIEIFNYYGVKDITAEDVCEFFRRIDIVQKKREKVFNPSEKKVSAVLDCFLDPVRNYLSLKDGIYHIEKWNSDGYKFELEARKNKALEQN